MYKSAHKQSSSTIIPSSWRWSTSTFTMSPSGIIPSSLILFARITPSISPIPWSISWSSPLNCSFSYLTFWRRWLLLSPCISLWRIWRRWRWLWLLLFHFGIIRVRKPRRRFFFYDNFLLFRLKLTLWGRWWARILWTWTRWRRRWFRTDFLWFRSSWRSLLFFLFSSNSLLSSSSLFLS